jgi:hypothetical protein
MYTTGVMLGVTVPFYYAVGAAISTDRGLTWEKLSDAPLLDRTSAEPYLLVASPFVLREDAGWRMWYMSGAGWELEDGKPKHYYRIYDADSVDGLSWQRSGRVVVDFVEGEYAISRPSVIRDADCYRMWFASRGDVYRICYAESIDGRAWERKAVQRGAEPSEEGWDSEMICYPHVFDHGDRRYMLYNGNGYGRTGFGLAVLEG